MLQNINFLILEKDRFTARLIHDTISTLNYNVIATIDNAKCAIDTSKSNKIDFAVIDVDLNGKMDGIECAHILLTNYNIRTIFISDYSDDETIERAIDVTPFYFLSKPFKPVDLESALLIATQRYKREKISMT